MANRFPLIVDTSDNNKIKELPNGDNLDLAGSGIVNAASIQTTGTLTAHTLVVNGQTLSAVALSGNYEDLDGVPPGFSGSYNDLINKPTIPTSTRTLTDVQDVEPSNGDVLVYNSITGRYEPGVPSAIPDLGQSTLGDIGNVIVSGDTTNKWLKFYTGAWRPASILYSDIQNTPTIPSDISELTDNSNLLGGVNDGAIEFPAGGIISNDEFVLSVEPGPDQTLSLATTGNGDISLTSETTIGMFATGGINISGVAGDFNLGNDYFQLYNTGGPGTGIETDGNFEILPGRLDNAAGPVTFNADGSTVFPGNLYGSETAGRLWFGGSNVEGSPSITIPSDIAGVTNVLWIENQRGGGIQLTTSGGNWDFNDSGTLTLPGAVVSSTDSPIPGTPTVGAATEIIVTNSPNPNWTSGTGVLANGINFVVTVDFVGAATVSLINDGGTGHFVGETFGPVSGVAFGGDTPADDMYFEVTAIDPGNPTPLDLGKQVQILTAASGTQNYSLADGTEGQIMYIVPDSTINTSAYIRVANARILDIGGTGLPVNVTNYSWSVFSGNEGPRTICTAIFADGAWCLQGGVTD